MPTPMDTINSFPAFDFGNYMPIHTCGVPKGYVAVLKTANRTVDGETAVFVYKDRVTTMALVTPYNYHDWSLRTSKDYDTLEELQNILEDATAEPKASCW